MRVREGRRIRVRRGARPVWLFDLDGTLHDVRAAIMPRINADMTNFVIERLGVEAADADRLRRDYWLRYGATLLGLIRHHGIDAHEFLRETHRFPDLGRLVRRRHALVELFRRLPGRKVILTNAPRAYAEGVIACLGLRPFLEQVVCIEDMQFAGRWEPKPSGASLRRVCARLRIDPRSAILVEDTVVNLRTARRLGMRTVFVREWPPVPGRRVPAGRARTVGFQLQSVLTISRTVAPGSPVIV